MPFKSNFMSICKLFKECKKDVSFDNVIATVVVEYVTCRGAYNLFFTAKTNHNGK